MTFASFNTVSSFPSCSRSTPIPPHVFVAGDKESTTDGYLIRRAAVDFGVSLITNLKCAVLLSLSLERVTKFHIKSMEVSKSELAACSRRANSMICPGDASSCSDFTAVPNLVAITIATNISRLQEYYGSSGSDAI